MELKGEFYVWDKSEPQTHISNHFTTKEMACKCTFKECREQKIAKELIDRLEKLRDATKDPIRVHSAYRCSAYQAHLRNQGVSTVVAKKSQHEEGKAVDVSSSALTSKALEKLASLYFKSIGLASNFLHLDLRDDKVRRWDYGVGTGAIGKDAPKMR
jgi:uncharacterized protein YcbK (DUF882 family)